VASAEFCNRLAGEKRRVHFSRILRLELSEAIRKLATKPGRLPADFYGHFQHDQWERNIFVRRRWFEFCLQQISTFIDGFDRYFELPFRESIWRASVVIMARDQLRSHDAIHVATARTYHIPCMATTDQHFRKITDLDIRLVRDH
jgi:hypothetical protein